MSKENNDFGLVEGPWRPGRPERWITAVEVAEYLGLSKWSVWRLVRQGKLPARRIARKFRFKLSEVRKWAERQKP